MAQFYKHFIKSAASRWEPSIAAAIQRRPPRLRPLPLGKRQGPITGLGEFLLPLSDTIHTLLQTQGTLKPVYGEHDPIADLVRRVELTPRDLATYAHFEPTRNYTRNLVATDGKHFTLLLLCWNPGHESPIHNHPCDGCWMKVVKGTVQECRYEESSQHQTQPQQEEQTLTCILDNLYHENESTYIRDSLGYHKVGNPSSNEPAVTLHLYCPPFAECKVWSDPASRPETHSSLGYHSRDGQLVGTSDAQQPQAA